MPKAAVVFSVLGLAIVGTAVPLASAGAGIACKDGFQMSGGQWISTPYCNDAHLAEIARQHGAKVSAKDMRDDLGKRSEVCRLLAGHPTARDYCPNERGFGRGL